LSDEWEPRALAVAESLTTRFPDDPRALMTLSKARFAIGDWPGAASALQRAIALDSAGAATTTSGCQLCQDYSQLAEVYLWWDSLPAAARTARSYLEAKPDAWQPLYQLALVAARLGDSASAYAYFRRMSSTGGDNRHLKLRLDITLGAYDGMEPTVRELLASPWEHERGLGADALLLTLRNEGRLRDAMKFHRTGKLQGYPAIQRGRNDIDEAILALERGDPRTAAAAFHTLARQNVSQWSAGYQARVRTWNATLEGMALGAAGDTLGVRLLADSVEKWGLRSAYGRDRKAHHYLRGLALVAAHRDADAVPEFTAAIHSRTLGFTRVNYDLARALLRLGRPREAVAILQAALRGEVDASNLYITRTELHELLAQAFDAAGQTDSAAVHYRAVAKAWRRADPEFHARRELATAWLDRHTLQASH
jgi:tetratricopeptide (TPR) repeat protein